MSVSLTSLADLQMLRDLGVAWMNRGHEFMLRNDPASLAAALGAYNEAIAVLRKLPLAEHPAWANSLGAALMNRGHLLHRLHGVNQATLALAAFDEAVVLLHPLVTEIEKPESKIENFWPRRNLAGTRLNRANLLLDLHRFAEGSSSARAALALVVAFEQTELVDADLALKARRTVCDAIGRVIAEPGADQDALAREASDLVDEALALTRHWADRGENVFQPLALRLFRYGAQLYRLHQPHFLAEFIRENAPPSDAERCVIAVEIIDAALADRPRAFLTVGDPASERHLQTGRDLAGVRAQLAAIAIPV